MGTTNFTKTPAVTGGSIQFGAEDVRRMSLDVYQTEGVLASDALVVSQRAAGANMSVDVAPGAAIIQGDDADGDQGKYYARLIEAETLNVTVTAADASNPRIDRVVLEIKDSDYDGSGLRVARIRTVDGTPTAGANAATNETGIAAMPDSAIELARLTVGAGVTSITTANIVDRRARARTIDLLEVQSFSATGTVSAAKSRTIVYTGSTGSQILTLPTVSSCGGVGAKLEILNLSTVVVQVNRGGTSDDFNGAVTSIYLPAGGRVELIATDSNTWHTAWPLGQQLANGYASMTTDSAGAGDKMNMSVQGDGYTKVRLIGRMCILSDGAAGAYPNVRFRDGSGGGGSQFEFTQAGGAWSSNLETIHPVGYVGAFSGSKTFYANLNNNTGTPYMMGASGLTAWMRAEWAPGHT